MNYFFQAWPRGSSLSRNCDTILKCGIMGDLAVLVMGHKPAVLVQQVHDITAMKERTMHDA